METTVSKSEAPRRGLMERLKSIGPGMVIVASFIGPGTVTTATRAGASFGYALLWAVLFSILATIILQEMSARLGIITQKGLGEAIAEQFSNPVIRYATMTLVIVAITVGSTAYITGDLLGGSTGLSIITGLPQKVIGPILGIIILFLALKGSYKIVEKFMIGLVLIMGVTFFTTMIVVRPNIGEVFQGAFLPSIPVGSIITVIALIGTTVVPYNLFLHAATVNERWKSPDDLKDSRRDSMISILIGGLITAAILITSATVIKGMSVESVADLSLQLEPVLGSWSSAFIGIGFFAAGLSSALAGPLGAAYTISGLLGWKNGMKDKRFKAVFAGITVFGIFSTLTGFEVVSVIIFAQAINGILLPFIAFLLLVIVNNKKRLGGYANNLTQNIIGGVVVIICAGLGIYSLVDAIGAFLG
ncbi:Manganese transport protein MntH [Bhargavaea cecembensis DSE10]|uniref:Manganese transport protein MntH n=1 Tax=Bhargavaea cecembensis DSE10 TaxID=1235279 RepID=M7NH89_9BACL|nr:Nramp family divalent metal transporter [Bhargavaea cecembensis]EMR06556.1 Manganese transport protein MntH [Bhargavaea cecembensis DSE10]